MNWTRETAWIQTDSGRRVHLLDPDPSDIDIEDIAVSLGRKPRFCGHSSLSVAQHSALVGLLVEGAPDATSRAVAHAYLHDGNEAYLPDVPSPLKHVPEFYALWAPIEAKMQRAVEAALGLPEMSLEERRLVEHMDLVALFIEKHYVLRVPDCEWALAPPPIPERATCMHLLDQACSARSANWVTRTRAALDAAARTPPAPAERPTVAAELTQLLNAAEALAWARHRDPDGTRSLQEDYRIRRTLELAAEAWLDAGAPRR